MDGKYVLIKDCLSTDVCTEIAKALRASPHFKYDTQCDKSRSFRDFPPCNILLGKMIDLFSDITNVKLKPTYTYARIYFKGSELVKHTDRPSCEYSVTINLSQSHPWPIYMDGTPLELSPGDAAIYMGCDVEHHRDVFEGDEYVQLFLHYVDANGPHRDHVFDTKNITTPEETFKTIEFEGVNPGIVNYYVFKNAFSNDELQYIIDQVSDDKLEFAGIGSGKVDQALRSTKVFWLPRTEQFKHVYYKIADMAVDANTNAYHFKIKAFREKIQYTVYKDDYNGHYSWHLDIGAKYTNRKLSIIVQMSDPSEYEGGEVQLWVDKAEPVTLEKDKGAVIIFPSYLLHRVTPVTKGTRRSLVTWIDGPVFR